MDVLLCQIVWSLKAGMEDNPNAAVFRGIFTSEEALAGSDNDLMALAERLAEGRESLPRLYAWCGTEDRPPHRRYHRRPVPVSMPHSRPWIIRRPGYPPAPFSVDTVYDGAAALDCFHSTDYDVIVLDIMMPKVNGLEVLKAVRREKAFSPSNGR